MTTTTPLNGVSDQLEATRGLVSFRIVTAMRWIAIAGQAAAVLVVYFAMGFQLPLGLAMVPISVNVAVTIWAWQRRRRLGRDALWLRDEEAGRYLAWDLVQLGLLLWLTGGVSNPFAIIILAPVTVSASILKRTTTSILAFLAIFIVTVLAVNALPLPWSNVPVVFPTTFIGAIWASLVLSILFVALYVSWLAQRARDMSEALTASQLALVREQRMSALGGLAAAAAHELGSPLSTIAVVAKELLHDLPQGSAQAEDAALLVQETKRCRDILVELEERNAGPPDSDDPYHHLPVSTLLEVAAHPHQQDRVTVTIIADPIHEDDDDRAPAEMGEVDVSLLDQPTIPRRPELIHGLGNFIQNAIQFADSEVTLQATWTADTLKILILDDGPGFDTAIMGRLGEPYVQGTGQRTRAKRALRQVGKEGGMGLGVFIARTLLEHTGASVDFTNRRRGGASVAVEWNRHSLVAES
ncbi:MAG: sensor histidine kinase [Alphaproteobacteria bacterium TMED89]|nr:two-component sensor histidine kinase [Rhodospirillaceae bacterium]RPH14963.1 MAG: sensor histidine kinase [Alphaproteobacteria bacterium TMED89]